MESFDKILKHFAFIIVFLIHAILLIALSFITFKAFKSTIFKEKQSNSAPVSFKSNDPVKILSSEVVSSNKKNIKNIKISDKIKSNIRPQTRKPVAKPIAIVEKPKLKPIQNIISEEEIIDTRKISEKPVPNQEISTNNNKIDSKPKMSGKEFLRQACNIYDANRYKEQKRDDGLRATNTSQYRHEQVMQERVAYWADHAYIEMLCEAIVEESNKHKDYYVYSKGYIDDNFPLSFSITADGKLHEIEYLTGIADIDRHLEAILRKAKFPVNKKCEIYQYKCNIRIVQTRKGLYPIKIEHARY